MTKKNNKTLAELCSDLWSNQKTIRSFVCSIKQRPDLIAEVEQKTSFLDDYDDVDLNERLYYIMNDIDEVIKCPYCGDKATFHRIDCGYRHTCKNKVCKSKHNSFIHNGNTKVSENREKKFKDWEKTITSLSQLNDEVIKENIVADKYLQML